MATGVLTPLSPPPTQYSLGRRRAGQCGHRCVNPPPPPPLQHSTVWGDGELVSVATGVITLLPPSPQHSTVWGDGELVSVATGVLTLLPPPSPQHSAVWGDGELVSVATGLDGCGCPVGSSRH